jgi:hypothetical protein
MSDNTDDLDVEIIRGAYAEKVKEAFIAFADNLSVGQQEKACRDRFVRAMELARKARDLALSALSDPHPGESEEHRPAAAAQPATGEQLSAEDQELIDHVLAGTTGAPKVAPPPTRFGHKS